MRFTTEVTLPHDIPEISHATRMLLMGSCFAQNIGRRLADAKFCVDVNPFGILYNPLSIGEALRRIISGRLFDEGSPEVFMHNGLWHSCLHHGDFSRADKAELLSAVNVRLQKAHEAVKHPDMLMLTFGTAYVYRSTADGRVVGNCHKLPQSNFIRTLLTVDDIVCEMSQVIELLQSLSPSVKVLFSVSPIRHLRDGAHDNQVSKATLLLATEELCRRFPHNCSYFPSYEIVLDELRDYRFYAEDMLHPSEVAQEYLWERFSSCCFSPATRRVCDEVQQLKRALEHRPFDPSSAQYRSFLSKILLKIAELQKKYPYFEFENEISRCNILLKE
ncbi:MAG: GSCFA domain-containing protein [Bacteroidaceae bacterium]|nr:GSCFA domain-containing protein [Bacteroidaceae bacterium]